MNKISYIVVFCLLTGCIPNNTNWAERLQEANQKASAYYDSLSEECLTDALNLYDEIADNSPEYRDHALMSKSIFLGKITRFEEAVSTTMLIPDTSAVFASFRTKSIHLNAILSDMALHNNNREDYEGYLMKINEELEAKLAMRRDSLYYAICSPIIYSAGYIDNEDVVAFIYYLANMTVYDNKKVNDVIKCLKGRIPEPNSHSKDFFTYLDEAFPAEE